MQQLSGATMPRLGTAIQSLGELVPQQLNWREVGREGVRREGSGGGVRREGSGGRGQIAHYNDIDGIAMHYTYK